MNLKRIQTFFFFFSGATDHNGKRQKKSVLAMASTSSSASLPNLYRDAVALLKKFDEGQVTTRDQGFAETLNGLIGKFKECLALIELHSLFSVNEEVEDVPTAHLKYVKEWIGAERRSEKMK